MQNKYMFPCALVLLYTIHGLLIAQAELIQAPKPTFFDVTGATNTITNIQQITPTIPTPTAITEQTTITPHTSSPLTEKVQEIPTTAPAKDRQLFEVDYTDEDLVSIINRYAALTGNNIILPTEGLAEKVTLQLREKKNLNYIWHNLLPTILDIAGFSIIQKANTYTIVKNDKDISREPVPFYVGVSAEKLPNTDQRIRYLYDLANMKVDVVRDILQTILVGPSGILPTDALFEIDPASNSIFLSAKANDIKAAMHIITQLDQTTFKEMMEKVRLKYTSAQTVAALFNENILKAGQERDRYRLDMRKESREHYFSEAIKIIPEPRTNSLIILGRPQAVKRIKDFIYSHIDVELDSGKSILHLYKLQYLDAKTFATTLQHIVESQGIGSTGQSRGGSTQTDSTERFFDGVIIKFDQPDKPEEVKHHGGNKLVIAARHDDWIQIKKLIEKLDIPQPQVLIEVLIADLSLSDARELGAMTRNPEKLPTPNGVNLQSAQFGNIVVGPDTRNPETIKADLLRNNAINTPLTSPYAGNEALIAAGATSTDTALVPQPSEVTPAGFTSAALVPGVGATVISFNDQDGKTWSLLQILDKFTDSKILSHPHVMATNNQEAYVCVGETRLLRDEASGSTGGAGVQRFKQIDAKLEVTITPRISSADLVNLNIEIAIDQFVSSTDNTRITRHFTTNANVANGSILALGGLIRKINSATERKTPILGNVPILGWFFKNRSGNMEETNLTVFILPTIVQPRLRPGVSKYTEDYVALAQQYAQEGTLFDGLHDPVTRWFFKTDVKAETVLNNFLTKDEFKLDLVTLESSTEPDLKVKERTDLVRLDTTKDEQLRALLKESENPLLSQADTSKVTPVAELKVHRTDTETAKPITLLSETEKPVLITSTTSPTITGKAAQEQHLKDLFRNTENPLLSVRS